MNGRSVWCSATCCLALLLMLTMSGLSACGEDEPSRPSDAGADLAGDMAADVPEDVLSDVDADADGSVDECLDREEVTLLAPGPAACQTCACNNCAAETLACLADDDCVQIVRCAQDHGCTDANECDLCATVISEHGGAATAADAFEYWNCFIDELCLGCGGEPEEDMGPDVEDMSGDIEGDTGGD